MCFYGIRKLLTRAVWPNWAAKCMQEQPSASLKLGSAPAFINITAASRCPCLVAQCNGVAFNSPPTASTSAPLSMKNCIISLRLLIAAQCNKVTVSLSLSLTLYPASTSSLTLANAPYYRKNNTTLKWDKRIVIHKFPITCLKYNKKLNFMQMAKMLVVNLNIQSIYKLIFSWFLRNVNDLSKYYINNRLLINYNI